MFILVYCADFNQDNTYHDVLLSMCGKRAQQLSALSILLTCYGINITFLVIIGDQYDRIFNSLLPTLMAEESGYWFLDRKFTIFVTSTLFIWPMCYAQRLDFLRYASVLGLFAMLYVAFLTVYEHYVLDEEAISVVLAFAKTTHQQQLEPTTNNENQTLQLQTSDSLTSSSELIKSVRWFEQVAIIPVLCFAYQTHEVIVPVYACMKERSMASFMKASVFGLIILFLLYNLVGAYGYLTFGSDVGADIMSLYDASDPIVVVGIVALVIKFITTYPPLMFCGRSALDGLYGELRKMSANEFNAAEGTRRVIISTLWFASTVLFAIFAPDISVTLQLLGSMASINVFVFPGMCLISLTRRLRRARLALLLGEVPDCCAGQQKAKDYHLISGSYFGAMSKRRQAAAAAAAAAALKQHSAAQATRNGLAGAAVQTNGTLSSSSCVSSTSRQQPQQQQQHFTATFASLIEFENNVVNSQAAPASNGLATATETTNGNTGKFNGLNGSRKQRREQEFERLIENGSIEQLQHQQSLNLVGKSINDSLDDYCVDDQTTQYHTTIGEESTSNRLSRRNNNLLADSEKLNLSLDKSQQASIGQFADNSSAQYQNFASQNQNCLHGASRASWKNNASTTGSILDRLGSSIAPTTVSQIGISRCTATGLFLFASLCILFGAFIFVIEFVSVFGFL